MEWCYRALEAQGIRTADRTLREAIVDFQRARGLRPDGIVGPMTLREVWGCALPSPMLIVERARAAAAWMPPVVYSMKTNTGLGESWCAPAHQGYPTGDCSDFVCHCLGIPKAQEDDGAVLPRRGNREVRWLGSGALLTQGNIGRRVELHDAQPGDVIGYPAGAGIKVGHVEIVVEAEAERIVTIGCSSSGRQHGATGSAIVQMRRETLWRRTGAWCIRPRWNDCH